MQHYSFFRNLPPLSHHVRYYVVGQQLAMRDLLFFGFTSLWTALNFAIIWGCYDELWSLTFLSNFSGSLEFLSWSGCLIWSKFSKSSEELSSWASKIRLWALLLEKNYVIRNNWYILKTNAKESTFSKALAQHFPVLQQSDQRDGNS